MPTRTIDAPSCWDTGYWLRRCEGFRLFVGDEPIGYVEDVAFGVDGEPAALAVCVGEDHGHRLTVPIDVVEQVDPAAERLHVGL